SSFTGRSRGSRSTRDHWQRERRWVLSVVQNGLIGDADVALHFLRHRFAGVQVPIEPWKVAARDVETDPMTRLEDVARLPERNLHFVRLIWRQEICRFARLPMPRPQRAL